MPIVLDPRAVIDFDLPSTLDRRFGVPTDAVGGFLPRLTSTLVASWRWARTVERRYRQAGPAGLDPADLPVLAVEDEPPRRL
jgi:hypothetical protein